MFTNSLPQTFSNIKQAHTQENKKQKHQDFNLKSITFTALNEQTGCDNTGKTGGN